MIRTSLILLLFATTSFLSACATRQSVPEPLPTPQIQGPSLQSLRATQTVDLSTPLSPDALAAIAVITNPGLQALRATEGVSEAQVFAADLYPDPTFSLGFDAPMNGGGLIPALGAGLGYDFAALAKRPSAMKIARSGLKKVRLDIAWAEWLTGEQARLLTARITHLRNIKALTALHRSYAVEDLGRALRAATRGDLPASSLEVQRLTATDAADRDRSAELQLKAAELDLNRLLGIDPAEVLSLAAPASQSSEIPAMQALYKGAIENRTDLAALKAGYEGANAAYDHARLGAYPFPSLGINAARDTSNVKTLGPSLSFTLPIWNRGRGDIAIARATQAQLRAEYAARLENIRADIAAARAALEITRAQRTDVARELQPLLLQVTAVDRAATRGDISRFTAAATHIAVLDKQIVEAALALSEAELKIALEISMGQPLETVR